MSQSTVEQELDLGEKSEGPVENNQDVTMESDSEDEGIQATKKRSKKMIIDDDDDEEEDAGDVNDGTADEGDDAAQEDGQKESDSNSSPESDAENKSDTDSDAEHTASPVSQKKTPLKKKLTAEEVLTEVLKDSDNEEQEGEKSDSDEGSDDQSDEGEQASQGPMKFNSDLFDAEESSDDNDLDKAAGAGYDSAEDKDFEESAIDPKLLKKLKKMKGASKTPREQKSRKCKPTKDDMLALHSESQRLMRETYVSLPYHKPAPKSLQDFLARAQKKQEAYKGFRKGRTLDIEKAQIIQEKIADTTMEKLPSVRSKKRFHGSGKSSSATDSQQDSGISGGEQTQTQSQEADPGTAAVTDKDLPPSLSAGECPLGEDELPDITSGHSDFLCDSQNTLKGSEVDDHSQNMRDSACAVERTDSQTISDGDDARVEQFDSPHAAEDSQSQHIEDVESLSVKGGDSQRSDSVTDMVPESLESNVSEEMAVESRTITHESQSETCVKTDGKVTSSGGKQSVEVDSGIENDVSKQLTSSSPVKAASQTKENSAETEAAPQVTEQDSSEGQLTLKAARQQALEELSQKGVVPTFGKGGGDFIILDKKLMEKEEKQKQKQMDRLLERLMRHYPKKEQKKPQNVEISIVEKSEEGQQAELKLNTVTYRTEGDAHLDLSAISHLSGNRLQALKERLEVGMRKRREAAYEHRQQMYKMENEEGFEEEFEDGLPAEEEEAELTDGSDTEEEEEEEEEEEDMEEDVKEGKDWNNPFLDDEAEDDDDDEEDEEEDERPQRPVCAEIDDMKEDDADLFQDSETLQLRLDQSDDEEDEDNDDDDRKKEEDDDEEKCDEVDSFEPVRRSQVRSQRLMISDDEEDEGSQLQSAQDPTKTCDPEVAEPVRRSQVRSQRLMISDDEEDEGSQLQSAQDPTKTCDPEVAGNLVKDVSFEMLTPMSKLLQDTQTSNSVMSSGTQPEDSQDVFGSLCNPSQTSFSEDTESQILDADGYFRVPSTQPRRSLKPSLMMEGSQDASDDHMDMLMGLCSGQFAEGSQGEGGGVPSSGGFEGLFDNNSQSDRGSVVSVQSDRGSVTSLFDASSQSPRGVKTPLERVDSFSSQSPRGVKTPLERVDSFSSQSPRGVKTPLERVDSSSSQSPRGVKIPLERVDSSSQSEVILRGFSSSAVELTQDSMDLLSKGMLLSEPVNTSSPAASQTQRGVDSSDSQSQMKTEVKKRGVKRRLLVQDDSSDEEGDEETNPFRILSDDEATKGSDKNELSGSDEEGHDTDTEQPTSFKGFKNKGKMLHQFVEDEAELSGSDAESDENVDLAEEEDFMEVEAGDQEAINEDDLRDQVGRVHMKQMLDDDDRQLMRYKEMYLPDGDLHSEGAGRQRRFHWKNFGDEASQHDLFANGSDEEKDDAEDPNEKQWRMERHEREKFLESQKDEDGEKTQDDNSQFMKFGQFFMKRQVSEPAQPVQQPSLSKPNLARSQSAAEKTSPGKFLKPKIPKRGSFLSRSKENLAKIAEMTKASGLNVNGTRSSRSFVFSVNSADKGDEDNKEQLLNKAAVKASAVKKVTPHKPPAKKQCVEPAAKQQSRKSIFRLFDK